MAINQLPSTTYAQRNPTMASPRPPARVAPQRSAPRAAAPAPMSEARLRAQIAKIAQQLDEIKTLKAAQKSAHSKVAEPQRTEPTAIDIATGMVKYDAAPRREGNALVFGGFEAVSPRPTTPSAPRPPSAPTSPRPAAAYREPSAMDLAMGAKLKSVTIRDGYSARFGVMVLDEK